MCNAWAHSLYFAKNSKKIFSDYSPHVLVRASSSYHTFPTLIPLSFCCSKRSSAWPITTQNAATHSITLLHWFLIKQTSNCFKSETSISTPLIHSLYKLNFTLIHTLSLILYTHASFTKKSKSEADSSLSDFLFESHNILAPVPISSSFHHHQVSRSWIQALDRVWSEGDSRFHCSQVSYLETRFLDSSRLLLNLSLESCCLMFIECVWCCTLINLSLY